MFNTQEDILADIDGQSQLLSAALSASRSGVLITDWRQPDNPIIYCNAAFTEMTGYTFEEIKGKNCRFLQAEDREQIGRYKLQDAIQKEQECHTELANYRKDGSIFYNEVYLSPVRNSDGAVTHFIGIQNDITIRKLTETSMQLELAIANKLQKKKDEFVCIASHELKTPITSLAATIQLINSLITKHGHVDGKISDLARHAERYSGRLIRLVNELLDSSNIVEGGLFLNKTQFPIKEIFDDCCHHLLLSGDHYLTYHQECDVQVYADRSKLYHVIANLVENAVKHAPESKEIDIEIISSDNEVKVMVTDKGPGIPSANAKRIFRRYHDGEESQGKIPGVGLGLFVSSEIIKRHGGEMGLDENYIDGARFWFTIPENFRRH